MSIEAKDLEQKLGILLSDRQDLVPALGDLTVVTLLIKRAIATPIRRSIIKLHPFGIHITFSCTMGKQTTL